MLRAIAIDDEPVALDVIRRLCRDVPFLELVDVFTDPFAALDRLENGDIDLLFLDIRMPDLSGTDLLKKITRPPMAIFTTAHSEHAVQSFELDAIDYLLKPFSTERFRKACEKAYDLLRLRRSASEDTHIVVRTGYEQVKIALSDILYVQSAGNYVQFILPGEKILSRLTMAETEAMLPRSAFLRIHRSYIVGRKHVHHWDKNSVYCDDTPLPVGMGYAAALNSLA